MFSFAVQPKSAPRYHRQRQLLVATIMALWIALGLGSPITATPSDPTLILKPARPPGAKSMAEMARWHTGYRQSTQTVYRALRALSQAFDHPRPKLERPCRQLRLALGEPGLRGIFPVPDRATDRHLRAAFAELRKAGRACRAGRPSTLIYHLQLTRGAFADVELTLRRYGLRP